MTTLASTHSGSLDATSTARTLVGGLAVAMLVPVLALAGLAIPLPASGYRLAAGLLERADVLAVGFGADRSRSDRAPELATIDLRSTAVLDARPASRHRPLSVRPQVAAPSAHRRSAAVLPGGRSGPASPRGTEAPRSPAMPTGDAAGSTPVTPAPTPATEPVEPAPSAPVAAEPAGAPAPAPAPADTKASSPSTSTDSSSISLPTLGEVVEGILTPDDQDGGNSGPGGGGSSGSSGSSGSGSSGSGGSGSGKLEDTVGTVGETVETVVESLPLLPPKRSSTQP